MTSMQDGPFLVTGASGQLGGRVMELLLEAGAGPLTVALTNETMGVVFTAGRPVRYAAVRSVGLPMGGQAAVQATVVLDGVTELGRGWRTLDDGVGLVLGAGDKPRLIGRKPAPEN